MEKRIYRKISSEERFWKYVGKKGDDDCWEWNGTKRKGYGIFIVDGKKIAAHRFSWQLCYGFIPSGTGYHGTCVLHKCDNPPCVNPKHLWIGTNKDNIQDKLNKGRAVIRNGSLKSTSKLTWVDVFEIRRLFSSGLYKISFLAKKFGVKNSSIRRIVLSTYLVI